ncbi:MAG: hypothetical protein WC197_02305 [Candidatus Gastranaerophilaceae bacterium]|jgi:hypothetical protein
MSEKLAKVIQIAQMAENAEEIIIMTDAFKARGKLIKDKSKTVEGVVTLTDATICPHFDICECKKSLNSKHEWLNIFEENIIAFTIIKR